MFNWDASIFKTVTIKERIKAQFRAEALNATNTVEFANPNTTLTNSSFGLITSQVNHLFWWITWRSHLIARRIKEVHGSLCPLSSLFCWCLLLGGSSVAPDSAGGRGRRDSTPTVSGPTPKSPDGHPDLSGYWRDDGKANPHGNIGKDLPGFKLPFTAAGEAAHKYNVEHTVDPESRCLPGGIPREDAGDGAFQLLQNAGVSVFLYQYGTFRLVPTDGRKHTEDPDPLYFGEEIGTWDGDTLVIDSIAFKQDSWADENADPHSDKLHTVERWTRSDAGHLHLDLLIDDPKYYSQPIHFQRGWVLAPLRLLKEQSVHRKQHRRFQRPPRTRSGCYPRRRNAWLRQSCHVAAATFRHQPGEDYSAARSQLKNPQEGELP